MKKQFIENLKNSKVPAAKSREELVQLRTLGESFSPLTENIKSELKSSVYWGSSDYFFSKLNLLANNFSLELCEHLIQVKERLQQIPAQGFSVDNSNGKDQSHKNTLNEALENTPKYREPDLNDYIPNAKLVDYLKDGDVSAIRAFLSAELSDFRLTIEELIKAVFFVEKNAKNVFEEYKTSAFIAAIEIDENKWNARYFDKQQGDLNQNFALERLFHLVNVRETLMRKGHPELQQINKIHYEPLEPKTQKTKLVQEPTQIQRDRSAQQSQPSSNFKVLAAIVAAGGLVLLALWKLINH